MITAIALAIFFRLNKALVILAAHISFAPLIPFIIYLSYKVGALWMGENAVYIKYSWRITLASIKKNAEQYIAGSIILAIVTGVVGGLLTFALLKILKRKSL